MAFLKEWMHDLVLSPVAAIALGISLVVLMRIFYPEAFGAMGLRGQFAVGMTGVLTFWALMVLALIFGGLPRREKG